MMLALLTVAGIDIGHVVDGGVVHEEDIAIVDRIGVGWVRINMRLDGGPDFDFAAYDRMIDAYLARGIDVYALINDEALSSTAPHGSDAWIADYVTAATAIVDHFKNRVRVYEIINEPNDYAGGNTARFSPAQFAKILIDTHAAIKLGHPGDRCWDVRLISGPLFSFDGNSSADYLQQTHAITGSEVVDGVGYHLYVAQGTDSTTADVRTQMLANLGAIDPIFGKPIWVSEYGWEASAVGETLQAERLTAGFDALAAQGNVETAFYFNLHDFPSATYGVDGRPAADALHAVAGMPLRAAAAGVAVPASVAPGALIDVVVRIENRGTDTWSPAEYRLAAAPGCPEAEIANAIAWEPTAGYADSIVDARAFLPESVASGATVALHVPVRAPMIDGDYTFAARMVHEGDRFFGPTMSTTIHVAAVEDPLLPIGSPAGCGCASSRDPSVLLALLALKRRKRRA